MPQDKKINVSVDDSGVSKLRQSANELAKDMIRSSRAYSTSSKEVLKDLEDQIKAIEKRNKLEEEGRRISIERARQSGKLTSAQATEALRGSVTEGREDKMQTQLLRELIDTVKSTAKEEIRESRSTVEEQVRKDKRTTQLSPEGDPEEILKRTIQREMLGTVGESETSERRKFKDYGKSVGAGTNQVLSTIASSPNAFYIAAAALAIIPFVGAGLSGVANKLIGGADRYEKSGASLAGIRGGTIDSNLDRLEGLGGSRYFAHYGMSNAEVAERMAGYSRGSGGKIGRYGDQQAMQLLAMEKVYGIDSGTMSGLAGIQRYDTKRGLVSNTSIGGFVIRESTETQERNRVLKETAAREKEVKEKEATPRAAGYGMSPSIGAFYAAGGGSYGAATTIEHTQIASGVPVDNRATFAPEIEEEEVIKGGGGSGREYTGIQQAVAILDRTSRGNHAVLQEMLQTFTTTSQQILSVRGESSGLMQQTAAAIHGVSKSTGLEGNQLNRVTSGLMGMGSSKNPVVKSLMLRSLRENNKGADFFDLQEMLENPFGDESTVKSLQGTLDQVKKLSGGGQMYKQTLYSMFEGKVSRGDINSIIKGDKSLDDIYKNYQKGMGITPTDQTKNLGGVVGNVGASTAWMESMTQTLGKGMTDFFAKMEKEIRGAIVSVTSTGVEEGKTEQAKNLNALTEAVAQGVERGMKRNK